jgi:hypothetical protein
VGPEPTTDRLRLSVVVELREEVLPVVGDRDERERVEAVEVVDDPGVLELVRLVERGDHRRAVVVGQPVEEFVVGGRLAVGVDGPSGPLEDPVDRLEPGVRLPAVDVDRLDVEDALPATDDELGGGRLPGAARAGQERRFGGRPAGDRFEETRERVHLRVPVDDVVRDERLARHPGVLDHLGGGDVALPATREGVGSGFPGSGGVPAPPPGSPASDTVATADQRSPRKTVPRRRPRTRGRPPASKDNRLYSRRREGRERERRPGDAAAHPAPSSRATVSSVPGG